MKSKARPFKRIVGPDLDTWAPLPYAERESPPSLIPLPIHHWGTWKWLAQDSASLDIRFVAVRIKDGREEEWAQKFVARHLFLCQSYASPYRREPVFRPSPRALRDWVLRRDEAACEFYDVDEFVQQRFEGATTKEVFGFVVALAECFRAEVAKIDSVPSDYMVTDATVDDVRFTLQTRFKDWLWPIYRFCYGNAERPVKEEYLP